MGNTNDMEIMNDLQNFVNGVESEKAFYYEEKDFTGRKFRIYPVDRDEMSYLYGRAIILLGEKLPKKDNYGNVFSITFIRKDDPKTIGLIVPVK